MRFREPETPSYGFERRLRLAFDPWIVLPAVVILGFSLAALWSVVYHPVAFEIQPDLATDPVTPFTKHLFWAILGLFGMSIFAFLDTSRVRAHAKWVYVAGLVLLVATLAFGVKVRNIRAWLSLGFITFQPSELVKAALVIALARYLSKEGRQERPLHSLFMAALVVAVPAGLVLKQPDMGTVIVYLSLLITLPFAAGLPARYLVLAVISGTLAGLRLLLGIAHEHLSFLPEGVLSRLISSPEPAFTAFVILGAAGAMVAGLMRLLRVRNALSVFLFCTVPTGVLYASFFLAEHLKEYQKLRLLTFIAPQLDPKGSGYNIIQSQVAFGSGGVLGQGLRGATQSSLGFLPERQTDFIFSVIGEVFGFVGATAVILCFLVLCLRLLWIAAQARDRFGSLLAIGVATILVTHVVVNMGMAIGITPIMGIPLPLASYGGTAMVSVFVMLGLVQAVERQSRL